MGCQLWGLWKNLFFFKHHIVFEMGMLLSSLTTNRNNLQCFSFEEWKKKWNMFLTINGALSVLTNQLGVCPHYFATNKTWLSCWQMLRGYYTGGPTALKISPGTDSPMSLTTTQSHLVVEGLSMRYETWPPIGWCYPVCDWVVCC